MGFRHATPCSRSAAQLRNMFPSMPATPYMQRPPIPGGPPEPHPAGSPALAAPPLPHYTHTPYTPHQPLMEVHSQPAYPAYYLREPRYGLPPPPTPPSPLPTVPPPDHRDLEVAYLRGHVAGLDRRTEGPTPPKETAQRAPPAPQGPAPNAVGEAAPALLLAPVRETVPRQDRRPPAPTEAPRRPQGATYRRSRSPRRDLRDDRRGHGRTSPGREGRTAKRRPYRSPERYYQRRSEERSSGHRAPAARGRDHTPDRRDGRSRRDPPGSAPGPGRERRGPDDRRRYRSPSPDTARRLRYDAPDMGRRPQWEPRTAPDAQPPHVPKDKPPRKRQRNNKESRQPAAQSPAGTPHRLPVHALAGTQTTPGLLAPRAQQARLPQDGVPRTPQRHRTGVTQTTPGLRGPGCAPPSGAMQAPQQPRAADPPTVLHIRRLPTGWSRRHLADRFMWLDGAEGVAEAFYGGENHGYLTFRAHTQALAACAVVNAALGKVAPPPGRLPAAVHCVNRSVVRDLTVYTQRDAQGEERHDTPSAGAAPPARGPPLPHGG